MIAFSGNCSAAATSLAMSKLDPMKGITRTPNGIAAGTLLPLSIVNRNENLNKIDMSLYDIKLSQSKADFPKTK